MSHTVHSVRKSVLNVLNEAHNKHRQSICCEGYHDTTHSHDRVKGGANPCSIGMYGTARPHYCSGLFRAMTTNSDS